MRNTRKVIETAKMHGGKEGDDIVIPSHYFPEGIERSYILLNDGRDKEEVRRVFANAIDVARLRTNEGDYCCCFHNCGRRFC